jgi:putative ABC transport system substrate-binding protein
VPRSLAVWILTIVVVLAGPLPAPAQQPARVARVGVLSADGRPERLPALASELVRLKPDLLVAIGGDVVPAAQQATGTIPIVAWVSNDPVQAGFADTLARPGHNITGITLILDTLAGKRLALLKEVAPRFARVGIVWNPEHADIVVSSRLVSLHRQRILDFAARNRLPLVGDWGPWAEGGALLAYGPNPGEMTQRAAAYVDRILKGGRPGDLPFLQPTKFELIVNTTVAKSLGLAVPQSILLRVDRVIE